MRTIKNTVVFFIILMLAVILAMRGDNTPDTYEYRLIFMQSYEDLNYEYLYILLNRAFLSFGASFEIFLLFVTLFLFYAWYKLTKQLVSHVYIAFVLFLPFYGFYFFGIILRASLAIIVSYAAIVLFLKHRNWKGFILYYVLIFIASGFHMSILVFMVLPLIGLRRYKNWVLFSVLAFATVLPFINEAIPIISKLSFQYLDYFNFNRVEGYLTRSMGEMWFSLTLLKHLIFGTIFVILRRRVVINKTTYNFFLNTYLLGCFLMSLFSFVGAGNRLAFLFLFFEFILLTLLYESSTIKKSHIIQFLALSVIINFIAIIQQGNGLIW